MANLVITIISIALVAVAALMGVYYGGSAYLSANPKAMANGMVNDFQQIESAWKVWATQNNGTIDPGDTAIIAFNRSLTSNNPLVPTYLAAYPKTSMLGTDLPICSPLVTEWMMVKWSSPGVDTSCLAQSRPVDALRISKYYSTLNFQVCDQMLKIFYGPTAGALASQVPAPVLSPFDCGWRDRNSNSVIDAGVDSMEFYYKVF